MNKLMTKLKSLQTLPDSTTNKRRTRPTLVYFRVWEFTETNFVHVNIIVDWPDKELDESQISTLQTFWNKFAENQNFGNVHVTKCGTTQLDANRIASYLTKHGRNNDFPNWLHDLPEGSLRIVQASHNLTTKKNAKRKNRQPKTGPKFPRSKRPKRSHREARAEIAERTELCRVTDTPNGIKRSREYTYNLSAAAIKRILGKFRVGQVFQVSEHEAERIKTQSIEFTLSNQKQIRLELLKAVTPLTDSALDLAHQQAEDEQLAAGICELRGVLENYIHPANADNRFGDVAAHAEKNLQSLVVQALLPIASVVWLEQGTVSGLNDLEAMTTLPNDDN